MSDSGTAKHDADRLQQLLEGQLSADEEARLLAEIERDETAQHRLEDVAADPQFRDDVREYLGHRLPPDSAMQRIIGSIADVMPEPEQPSLDFLEPADSDEFIGHFDDYRIIECVGSGGMGIVLKAFDPTLNRIVALKVLSPHMAAGVNARQRFLREARAAAAVSHDHITTIHAVGEWNGLPYLVMEFISGVTLQHQVDTVGPLELKEILRIGMQVASGLSAAHAQGLVHRDVKPGNILLENSVQRVKITDFGLARTVDDVSITRSGMVTGTPEYMAPEQARDETLDHRADLFSLGSVLYAMCTGESPFRTGSLMTTLRRVSDETPRPIRELNPDIPDWPVGIVGKLHSKDAANRYQTAQELSELLARHLAELQQAGGLIDPATGNATGTSDDAKSDRTQGPRSRWFIFGGLFLAIAVAGLVVNSQWNPAKPNQSNSKHPPVNLAPSGNDEIAHAAGAARASEQSAVDDEASSVGPPPNSTKWNLTKTVTLKPPYTIKSVDAPQGKLSARDVAMEVCRQVGVPYLDERSFGSIRSWVYPDFENVPAHKALDEVLAPVMLTYRLTDDGLSLAIRYHPATPASLSQKITLKKPYPPPYHGAATDKLSIQYAVRSICNQIGVDYQFYKSKLNIGPLHNDWVYPDFVEVPADVALTKLLQPLGLTYVGDEYGIYLKRIGDTKKTSTSSVRPQPSGSTNGEDSQ